MEEYPLLVSNDIIAKEPHEQLLMRIGRSDIVKEGDELKYLARANQKLFMPNPSPGSLPCLDTAEKGGAYAFSDRHDTSRAG